jgi:WD40 repeat protein
MSSQDLNRAIQLARAGDKKTARQILLQLVQKEPTNEMAWIWLADTMPDDARRIATLKQCLKLIPDSQIARKALQVLESAHKPPPTVEKPSQPAVFQPGQPSPPPVSPPPAEEPAGFESLLLLRDEVVLPEEESQPPPFVQGEETEQEAFPLRGISDGEQPSVTPFVETAAIEQLRQQAQKVPPAPASVVRQKVSPVRWGAILGILLFAVVLGVVVFTLWFSPNSPLRLSGLQPLPTQLNYQPPQETPVIETQVIITPQATEEVEATEEVKEIIGTPPPPGIYLSGTQVNSFDWSPDDTFVVVSAGGGLSAYDPQNYGTLRYVDLAGSKALCRISPAVDRTVCAGQLLWAWSLPEWNLEIESPPPSGLPGSWIGMFDFVTSDLLTLVYESDLQSVEIWSLGIQQRDGDLLRAPSPIQRLTASPESGSIAAGLFDGQVIIWGLQTRQPIFQQSVLDQPVQWLALSADGKRMMTAAALPPVRVWEIPSGRLVAEIQTESTFTALAFSADGENILWADKSGVVTLQQVEDGSVLNRIEVGVPVREIRFSPDQTRIAVVTTLGDIYFYSLIP